MYVNVISNYYLLRRAEEDSELRNKKKIYFLGVTHQNFHLELCAIKHVLLLFFFKKNHNK